MQRVQSKPLRRLHRKRSEPERQSKPPEQMHVGQSNPKAQMPLKRMHDGQEAVGHERRLVCD
ncbi:unnamed protein product [Ectocarpus sp. CCAP 1310/34]|nr:unnamed protein product [Ectocarpus sp. CCAP 1310/34]